LSWSITFWTCWITFFSFIYLLISSFKRKWWWNKKEKRKGNTLTISIWIHKSILSTIIFWNTKCPFLDERWNTTQTFSIF